MQFKGFQSTVTQRQLLSHRNLAYANTQFQLPNGLYLSPPPTKWGKWGKIASIRTTIVAVVGLEFMAFGILGLCYWCLRRCVVLQKGGRACHVELRPQAHPKPDLEPSTQPTTPNNAARGMEEEPVEDGQGSREGGQERGYSTFRAKFAWGIYRKSYIGFRGCQVYCLHAFQLSAL